MLESNSGESSETGAKYRKPLQGRTAPALGARHVYACGHGAAMWHVAITRSALRTDQRTYRHNTTPVQMLIFLTSALIHLIYINRWIIQRNQPGGNDGDLRHLRSNPRWIHLALQLEGQFEMARKLQELTETSENQFCAVNLAAGELPPVAAGPRKIDKAKVRRASNN